MEISIPTQSSLKSTLITYLVLLLAIKVIALLGNFTVGPALCNKLCLMYGQTGKFLIFPFQFGSLAIKVIAFWEILPLGLLHTQKWCLMYGQM